MDNTGELGKSEKEPDETEEVSSHSKEALMCISTTNDDVNESGEHSESSKNPVTGIRHFKSQSFPIHLAGDNSGESDKFSCNPYRTIQWAATTGTAHVVNAASKVVKSVTRYGKKLVYQWELPEWLKDNIYIHSFHRPQLDSFKQCFKSIFSIHSETGNIWSHLIGLLIMMSAAIYTFTFPHASHSGYPYYPLGVEESLVFSAFFAGACACMTFSWLFHTLICHSQGVYSIFAKLDYSGISLLISGSLVPVIYFGFYCLKKERIAYMVLTVTLAAICIFISLWSKVATPRFRPLRAGIFLVFGLSGVVPIIHIFAIYPRLYAIHSISLYWVTGMGALYIIGTMMYTFMIPERYFPGRINLIFQSHQIFHVCVVIAAILHLHALCLMAEFRVKRGRTCYGNETAV